MYFNSSKIACFKYLILLLTIISTPHIILKSRFKVTMRYHGVTLVNPCSTSMLGNFFPDVKAGSVIPAEEHLSFVTNICPNLRYSCCRVDRIKTLVHQLQQSLKYMDYQFVQIQKMLERAEFIAEESFKIFLSEMTGDDIKCYNDIQENLYNDKMERFKESPKLVKLLKQNKYTYKFSKELSLQRFLKMKSLTGPYLNKMESLFSNREKYYSSFVCNMCSPTFTKYFRKRKDGIFELDVNRHMCKRLVKKRIAYHNSLYLYKYLQDIINLTYCVRKNSKKDQMDYDNLSYEEHKLLKFDIETLPHYLEKRRECLNTPGAFMSDKVKGVNCRAVCKHSLKLFDAKIGNLDHFIKIENDLTQMFQTKNSKEEAKKLYEEKIKKYHEIRQEQIEKGILFVDEGGNDRIRILRTIKNNPVDFRKMEISVDRHLGVNVQNTPMDQEIIHSSARVLGIAILGLMIMLGFNEI